MFGQEKSVHFAKRVLWLLNQNQTGKNLLKVRTLKIEKGKWKTAKISFTEGVGLEPTRGKSPQHFECCPITILAPLR